MKKIVLLLVLFVIITTCGGALSSSTFATTGPQPVKNLKATPDYSGNIHLSWNKSDNTDGYIIFRMVGNQGKFQYLYMVKNNRFADIKAPKDVFSFYRVHPYQMVNGRRVVGKSDRYVYSKPMYISFPTVTDLTAEAIGPNRVLLKWSVNGDADGYIVYRKIGSEGDFRYRYILQGKSFVDGTAQNDVNNFYRVYPYKVINGKRVQGYSDNYHWAKPRPFKPYEVYVNTSVMNVRKSPYGDKIGETYRYEVHTVYGGTLDSDGKVWFKIRYDGQDAYIASWYTKLGRPPKGKPIAITFDDGPSYLTSSLLNSLDETDAKVTFFVLGQNIPGKENIIRRAHNAGHEIGNHSMSHPELNRYYYQGIYNELAPTNTRIQNITGRKPRVMRPPYGSYDGDVKNVCRDLGLSLILWNVDTEDWRYRDADYVERYILNYASEGSIVLLHDIHPTTVAGFKRALPKLIERGYRLVTVSELMELKGIHMRPGEVYYSAR